MKRAIVYLPEYFSDCICSVGTVKFPVVFGGQPFRLCCVRSVCVACRDGPRGGTSGGAGSGGESLPVSGKRSRDHSNCVAFLVCVQTARVNIWCVHSIFRNMHRLVLRFELPWSRSEWQVQGVSVFAQDSSSMRRDAAKLWQNYRSIRDAIVFVDASKFVSRSDYCIYRYNYMNSLSFAFACPSTRDTTIIAQWKHEQLNSIDD